MAARWRVLVVVCWIVGLASCGTQDRVSPNPRTQPAASSPVSLPTLSATARPSASTGEEIPAQFAETSIEVEVFTEPSALREPFTRIESGRWLYLVGPDAPGDWHRVQFADFVSGTTAERFGWIQSKLDGEQTFGSVTLECPDALEIASLAPMPGEHRRRCAHGEIALVGYLRAAAPHDLFIGEPPWLATDADWMLHSTIDDAAIGGALGVHFPPGIDLPPLGVAIEVTGHFDDAEAIGCRRQPRQQHLGTETPAEQELWCRQQFVVSDWEPGP